MANVLTKFHNGQPNFDHKLFKLTNCIDSQWKTFLSDQIESLIYNSMQEYETWVNRKNVSEHTCAAYGHGLPWPLKLIVPRIEQCKFCWNHWEVYQRPENEVLLDFEQACAALSERLGRNETFFPAG